MQAETEIDESRVSLPILRGTAEGADCEACPFSFEGRPHRAVFSERTEKTKWIIVGEGPGFNEVRLNRPFIGATGDVVMKLLGRIGCSREDVMLNNAALCQPTQGSSDADRHSAAKACKTRLQLELAQFPGMPILTLGAVAARSVIPQSALDAIDPPDVPESKQKRQKRRQKSAVDEQAKREKRLSKIEGRILCELITYQRKLIKENTRGKASKAYVDSQIAEVQPQLVVKAKADAEIELTQREAERVKKPKKKKPIKISDIVGTCFDVDIDGTGPRSVIPAIHPAALLRGGGKSIAGSHTPDLAYVNLTYDFGKVNALAEGKNIRLELNVAYEGKDPERATWLFVEAIQAALDEGSFGLDLETYVDDPDRHHALMAYVARIKAIGIATKHRSVSVAWDLIAPWAQSYFQALLASRHCAKVFHNCLTGDSRVSLPDGSKVRLDRLVKQKYRGKVLCVNEVTGELEERRVLDWVRGPKRPWKDWLRIRVKGKGCLRLTIDHEVITERGRVIAKDIRLGDRILTTRLGLSDQQQALVFGSLLGDASISKGGLNRSRKLGRRRSPFIRFAHCAASQHQYARFKARVLGDLISNVYSASNDRGFSVNTDSRLIYVSTKGDPRFNAMWGACVGADHRKKITDEWLKCLTPAALAIWFCDDGHRSATNAVICVEAFHGRGLRRLVSHLRKLGWPIRLERRKEDSKYYLKIAGPRGRGLSSQMDRFWRSLAPFIPKCMAHKLPDRFRYLIDESWWKRPNTSLKVWADEVVEVGPLLRAKGSRRRYGGYSACGRRKLGLPQFCLVVEGNRNFFSEGLAVSNCLYDVTVLRANGYEIAAPIEDTLLAHHSAFPGCAHNLQTVTSQFFATEPWKADFRNSADEDIDKLLVYNAKDTGATYHLRKPIGVIVKKNKNERTYDIDLKMAECASRMHLVGMPVDREVNSQLLGQFTRNVAESREAVEAIARDSKKREQIWNFLALEQAKTKRKTDVEDYEERYNARLAKIKDDYDKRKWRFKISASKHVAALIQAMGVQLKQVTPSGTISTKKEVLESLVDVPMVRDLLTYRENDKLLSVFVWAMFDRHVDQQLVQTGFADVNDRIHPIWNIHKITGRWASYEPVVSNVPKGKLKRMADGSKKLVRPNLRAQIKAPPGRLFVGFDFGQLEMRVIALRSGDPFLCDVFARGKDIHTECARVVFPTFDQLGKDEAKQVRDQTKPLEYASVYGANPETCWKGLLKEGYNVKLVDVVSAIQKIMSRMSGVIRWQRQQVAIASTPPYVISSFLLNRRRTWPMGQIEATEALNFGIQSSGADIMNTGMARMMDRLTKYKEAYAIVQVHDAAVFECWAEDAEDIANDVKECFEQEHTINGITIPFPIDLHIGEDWSKT